MKLITAVGVMVLGGVGLVAGAKAIDNAKHDAVCRDESLRLMSTSLRHMQMPSNIDHYAEQLAKVQILCERYNSYVDLERLPRSIRTAAARESIIAKARAAIEKANNRP